MVQTLDTHIKQLESMKKYPKQLYYIGNKKLLQNPMISIVGSRNPNQYTVEYIHKIASSLSQNGNTIVSGGAIGVDTIVHRACGFDNTIMVAGTGLNKKYPQINANMIANIEQKGLMLSQFEPDAPSTRYNFPLRNEVVVALGDILIVAYADEKSGTMRSVEYALKMGKKIFVLPHRIDQSNGTNKLLAQNKAQAIYDVDEFVANFKHNATLKIEDEFLNYCNNNPSYDEAVAKYQGQVFEYEFEGKIATKNGRIYIV